MLISQYSFAILSQPESARCKASGNIEGVGRKVIVFANTVWRLPVVLFYRRNGSLQVCINFSEVNNSTIQVSHNMQKMNTYVDAIQDTTIILTSDSSIWNLEMGKAVKNRKLASPP